MVRYSILVLLAACGDGILQTPGGGTETDSGDDGLDPNIAANVAEIDFGDIDYGTPHQDYITLSNTGGADLVVKSINVEAPFTVNPLSVTISPGSSSQVTVSITSTTYEEFNGAVVITSDDPDQPELSVALHAATIVDADGDGHDRMDAGGDDCDDSLNTVNPDANEIWYDGIDENCDGLSDYDQDGDGYESDAFNENPSAGGGDCQDSDPEYFPYADDVPYDNRDTDCDGADDYDYDGDGSRSEDYGKGLDCDDYDAEVNISSDEQLNGKDDDCDGEIDTVCDAALSEYLYVGKTDYDQAGYAVALGDLDDDGMAEVIVGGPYYNASSAGANGRGIVAIFEGDTELPASPGDLRDAAYTIQGDGSSDGLGFFVTVLGDYDGDGTNDLAMSALPINSNGGAVYILTGDDVMRGRDTSDSLLTVSGSSSQYAGRGLGTNIDLDGDGVHDLLAAYASGSYNAVALEYGGGSGSLTLDSTDAQWSSTGTSSSFYRNFPVASDVDGDGYADVMFSDGTTDSPSTDAGSVWVVWGGGARYSGSTAFTSVATTIGTGASSSDGFGTVSQAGPDISGDGVDDIWVYEADTAVYAFAGGAYLRSSTLSTADALVRYDWSSSADAASLRRGGDFTGDGIDDMFIGIPDYSSGAMFYLASELLGSGYNTEEYWGGYASGSTDNENGAFGFGLAPVGADIDGDGDRDFIAGDPEKLSSSSTKEGEAYVLFNENLGG